MSSTTDLDIEYISQVQTTPPTGTDLLFNPWATNGTLSASSSNAEPANADEADASNMAITNTHDLLDINYSLVSKDVQHGTFYSHYIPLLNKIKPYASFIPRYVIAIATTTRGVYNTLDIQWIHYRKLASEYYQSSQLYDSVATTSKKAENVFKSRFVTAARKWVKRAIMPPAKRLLAQAWSASRTIVTKGYEYSKTKKFWQEAGSTAATTMAAVVTVMAPVASAVISKVGFAAWKCICYAVEQVPWVAEQANIVIKELTAAVKTSAQL